MNKRQINLLSKKLKAITEPNRLRVLDLLQISPMFVKDIKKMTKIEETLLSFHLKILRLAGLVTTQRKGKMVLYIISQPVKITEKGVQF